MKLQATAQSGTCSVDGVTYDIKNGVVDVTNDQHAAQLVASHGFTAWAPGAAAEDETSELDETKSNEQVFIDALPTMTRGMMQRTLKDLHVAYPQSAKNDELRAMLKTEMELRMKRHDDGKPTEAVPTLEEVAAQAAAELDAQREENVKAGHGAITDEQRDAQIDANDKAGLGKFSDAELDFQRKTNGGKTAAELEAEKKAAEGGKAAGTEKVPALDKDGKPIGAVVAGSAEDKPKA